MVDAVQNIATDFAAVMSTVDAIEVLDLKGSQANQPYEPLVDEMNRAIVSLFRGGDLSTMSSKQNSEGHGSNRQEDEAEIIEDDDVEMIDETLHHWVTRYVIEYVHGDVRPLARYKTVRPPDRSTAHDLATDQFLLSAGVPLGVDDAYKRYGRVPPRPGEPVLQAIQPVQPSTKETTPTP